MITIVSIVGVALGVAALLSVLSITTGFEKAFRDRVLGVNAHVLVLKYGRDFRDYREVLDKVQALDSVAGAAPFVINEMMLAKEDRLRGVLVKGVTPEGIETVLDLPRQITSGDLEGLRLEGAKPLEPVRGATDDWEWLEQLRDEPSAPGRTPVWDKAPIPRVRVATPDDVEALLDTIDDVAFPQDTWEAGLSSVGSADIGTLPGMVVGKTLAEELGMAVGDRVTLISPLSGLDLSIVQADAPTTRSRDFRVIAIFEAGFQEYDARLVYTDLYEAQPFYEGTDAVTGVELKVHDLDTSEAVARRIERDLGGAFHTLDWSELNRNLFTALEIQKVVLTLVIATIIFVAAFNVIATLIMIVLEKKREVAILKAMGATDRTVLGVFMVQGIVIGVAGTLIGLVIGAGLITYLSKLRFPLDPKVYLIDHLPVVINPMVFVITAAIALLICVLSTIAPSWWAARMLPVDGLRYE